MSEPRREKLLGAIAPFVVAAVLAPISVADPSDADARQRNLTLRSEWGEICDRIMEGHPWGEIAADLKRVLDKAGETEDSEIVAGYLKSVRLAEAQPEVATGHYNDATPEELVAALTESRIVSPAMLDPALLARPLHMHRRPDGTRQVHWADLGAMPLLDITDPAIHVFHRGRSMIPYLLEALEDRTATRAAFSARSSRQLAVLYRRCDLAMALTEAIARCRFYVTGRYMAFSLVGGQEARAAVELARTWWQETKDLPELKARGWLLERIPYEQADPMIEVFVVDERIDLAVQYLRSFLLDKEGAINMQVAPRLADLGDPLPIDNVVERVTRTAQITSDQAELLVRFGGRREYMLLSRFISDDTPRPQLVSNVLKVLIRSENRLAVPVFAAVLERNFAGVGDAAKQRPNAGLNSDVELAAGRIQLLTGVDFRYDENAKPESRLQAIQRIHDWWNDKGKTLYGFEADRLRRTGGIR